MKNPIIKILVCALFLCPIFFQPYSFAEEPVGHLKVKGYKEATWGMNRAQLKKALKLEPIADENDQVDFRLSGGKTLTCFFLLDTLFSVQVGLYPIESAADVEKKLIKQYGEPDKRDPETLYWFDGIDTISFNSIGKLANYVLYTNHRLWAELKAKKDKDREKSSESDF